MAESSIHCQSFRQGCCGCCVNMRWRRSRLANYLEANTRLAERVLKPGRKPGRLDLARFHLLRGGWLDHLLVCWLVPVTLGLTVWLWRRVCGSCCFSGFIDRAEGRVGCLIHPARWPGGDDLRKNAFPLVPTLGCDRDMICPMLRRGASDLSADWHAVSCAGADSLRELKGRSRRV